MARDNNKRFTIMIIPHSEKEAVTLNIPVYIFKAISVALVAVSVFSIMFIMQYYEYKEEAQYAQRSKIENKSLTREFAAVAKDAIELKEKVARIEELDMEIRKQNEFDPTKSFFAEQNVRALAGDLSDDKSKVTASSMIAQEAQGAVQVIKESLGDREESLEDLQILIEQRNRELSVVPSIWPTSGRMVSGFGYRKDPFTFRTEFHTGIDVSNSRSTPIYAAADGYVSYTKYEGSYGYNVLINHSPSVNTRYAHLTSYAVKPGDYVKKGQLIAYMGSSGRATGPHLHYEVIVNGKAVDPYKYLP